MTRPRLKTPKIQAIADFARAGNNEVVILLLKAYEGGTDQEVKNAKEAFIEAFDNSSGASKNRGFELASLIAQECSFDGQGPEEFRKILDI